MGKREKEHRKKVQKRNAKIKQEQTSFQKKLQKMMTEKLEEYKSQQELGKNDIVEIENIHLDFPTFSNISPTSQTSNDSPTSIELLRCSIMLMVLHLKKLKKGKSQKIYL